MTRKNGVGMKEQQKFVPAGLSPCVELGAPAYAGPLVSSKTCKICDLDFGQANTPLSLETIFSLAPDESSSLFRSSTTSCGLSVLWPSASTISNLSGASADCSVHVRSHSINIFNLKLC